MSKIQRRDVVIAGALLAFIGAAAPIARNAESARMVDSVERLLERSIDATPDQKEKLKTILSGQTDQSLKYMRGRGYRVSLNTPMLSDGKTIFLSPANATAQGLQNALFAIHEAEETVQIPNLKF